MTPDPSAGLNAWTGRTLRQAGFNDLLYCAVILALAALCLLSGRAATLRLAPDAARDISAMLDSLELPRVLPDAVLVRDDGASAQLWELTASGDTIIAFYAPWCAACQVELSKLVEEAPDKLLVAVGADEDAVEVRRQLDNLGLKTLRYYVDSERTLTTGARVTALPTTFLVGRLGQVRDRVVGFSPYRLSVLVYKATGEWEDN